MKCSSHGTSDKYMTLQDFDGDYNPFKVPLGSDGRVVMLADPSLTYDIYVYNSYNDLVCSRLNVECTCPGNISIKGADTWVRNTDGTLDISLRTSANNRRVFDVNTRNKILDVQSPLYFVENSPSATIIGIKGSASGYVTKDYVDSVVSGKLDTSAFSAVSGDFLTDKFEYDSDNNITAYNHSAFAAGAGSGTIYEAGDHIDITNSVISVTGLPTSSDVENAISSAVTNIENKFEYNENNYITAYNNSAFAGTNYSAGDYVSIENDTISVTGLQPSGDYATKTELSGKQDTLSAGDGISIVNNIISVTSQGGGIEQVNHDDTLSGNGNDEPLGIANIEDFVKHNDLTAYQEKGDYYSASNPSGFITNDALTGLQPSGDYVTRDELTAYQPSGNYATIEDVESAVSGKQDILSAGEGIQIINNTISVTAQGGGGGITVVNHDNTLSGNGNSEPLGLANAEDYVKQDDLTGYATTALVSSVSSELYSAFSGISGDYALVAGNGVELVDDPNAKTTTINVTAEGTPVTAIEQMIESATSGLQQSGDYYSASNPSGFISEIPYTYLQNTDLATTDGKVTAISGIPLSAGGDVPDVSAIQTLMGLDETVLFSGDLTGNGATAQLSEPIQNFEKIKVYGHTDDGIQCPWFTEFYPNDNTIEIGVATNNAGWGKWFNFTITTGGLYTNVTGRVLTFGSTKWGDLSSYGMTRVIGIGRKA